MYGEDKRKGETSLRAIIDNYNSVIKKVNTLWAKSSSASGITVTQISGIIVDTTDWTLISGFYEKIVSNASITASSVVDVIPENDSITIVQTAGLLPMTLSEIGTVKLYSANIPTGDITVTLNIWK